MNHRTPGTLRTAGLLAALLLLPAGPALAGGSAQVYGRSYQLEARKQYRRALSVLASLPERLKNTYFHQLRLGWLTYLSGDNKGAVQHYSKAAAYTPRAVEPYLGMMLPQMASRRWKDAEAAARKVLRMAPGHYLATQRLAWVLYNLGRYDESARVYKRLLVLYPSNLSLRTGLGWALLKAGKKGEAVRVFRLVLSLSPDATLAKSGIKAAR